MGPFDHPEAILPLDGTAPENGDFNGQAFRDAVLASCVSATNFGPGQQACMSGLFLHVPETGTGGNSAPLPNFMGISSGPRLVGAQANCRRSRYQPGARCLTLLPLIEVSSCAFPPLAGGGDASFLGGHGG